MASVEVMKKKYGTKARCAQESVEEMGKASQRVMNVRKKKNEVYIGMASQRFMDEDEQSEIQTGKC